MTVILNGDRRLESQVNSLYQANYTQARVYPTLAAGATVISANADWVLGAFATLIPAATVTSAYHISSIAVETCNVVTAVFELAIYYGDTDTLMSTVRFSIAGGFWGNSVYLVPSVTIQANARVRIKLASSDGLANPATLTVSAIYRLLE